MLNYSGDKLITTLNIVLRELYNQLDERLNLLRAHLFAFLCDCCIYMYVEYDNLEELKAQFDLAPIKVLEDFFKKCWTKEYLQNPLVLVLQKPVCISNHTYKNIIVSLLSRY